MKCNKNQWIIAVIIITLAHCTFSFADGALSLNGSSSGSLSEVAVDDWWTITVPSDGSLTVNTEASGDLEIDLYMYDAVTDFQIANYDISWGSSEQTHHNSIMPGTYKIKAHRYSGAGTYTISNTFVAASLENDSEPNNDADEALTLSINSSDTGHLGYVKVEQADTTVVTDTDDWWKITTTSDGSLIVSTVSDSTLEIDLFLYDADDMETSIANYDLSWGIEEKTHYNGLIPGTYYVKTHRYSGYGSYTISSEFIQTELSNDSTNNETAATAQLLEPNGSDTGHLGHYGLGDTDTEDWWSITVPFDGSLTVSTVSDSTLNIDLFIYDVDQETDIANYDISWGIEERTHHTHLKAGTYYIFAKRYSGYGSYEITSEFIAAQYNPDAEPNDAFATALSISPFTTYNGHGGYYSAGSTDSADYYAVTIPSGYDTLFVCTESDSTLEIDLYLYSGQDTPSIAHGSGWGTFEKVQAINRSAGTYYIEVKIYSGYGAYSLIVSNSTSARPSSGSVIVEQETLPEAFALSVPYPNPFNPSTTIEYEVPSDTNVRLTVFNLAGQAVQVLKNERQQAGLYSVTWNAAEFPSGVYFCILEAEGFRETRKMVLVK